MDLNKTLKKINNGREKAEAGWVFSLWKNPELYAEYMYVNEGKDETLRNPDAVFYYRLGKNMYLSGYKKFDHLSITTYLEDKPEVKKRYENYGGYHEIEEIESIVDPSNVDGYFDAIIKANMLTSLCRKYNEVFEDVDRFASATSEDVYNAFELLNSAVSLKDAHSENAESLAVDDSFIEKLVAGENIGFNYGRFAPILNYTTLGCAPGSLYMVAGHSGTGKSSFVFGAMIMGLHYAGVPTAIISNEMGPDTYKILLLEHILTVDMNYFGLTRKALKIGKFTEDQMEKIREAEKISQEEYSDIVFVKMFDNNIDKIIKYLRRLRAKGVQCVLYDTFKSDDSADTSLLWQSLMIDARRLFQCCSKLGICCITTYQLALHTTNQRYLDAGCLSQSKQIKEVYETMVYFRPLWDDEYSGEKFDVHPYRISTRNGVRVKEEIQLDKDEKYLLLFLDKTRADEDKQVLIYQWKARFNQWKELGFAKVFNEHKVF